MRQFEIGSNKMIVVGKLNQEFGFGIQINWEFGIVDVQFGFWYLNFYYDGTKFGENGL